MDNVDKVDKVGNVDKVDKVDNVDKVDKVDNIDKVDKVDNVDKVDKVDNIDKVDKADKVLICQQNTHGLMFCSHVLLQNTLTYVIIIFLSSRDIQAKLYFPRIIFVYYVTIVDHRGHRRVFKLFWVFMI